MKDAVIPQVPMGTELRASLDAVLCPGETQTDFVDVTTRNAIEYRRVQIHFASRRDATLPYLSLIEVGRKQPTISVLYRLATALDLTFEQFAKLIEARYKQGKVARP